MKKLITVMLLIATFAISHAVTIEAQTSDNLINGDFSNGLPDGWEVYNESSVEVLDGYTRIYQGTGTNPFDGSDATQLVYDLSLPAGTYMLKIDYLNTTQQYTSDNEINVFTSGDNAEFQSISGETTYENALLYIDIEGDTNSVHSLNIAFEGGYQSSPEEYDYLDITSMELVQTDRKLMDGTLDTETSKTQLASGDLLMTEANMTDAHIYLDNTLVVENGSIYSDSVYDFDFDSYEFVSVEDWYELQNSDTSNGLEFATAEGQVYVQGEVGSDGVDSSNFPMDVQVLVNEDTQTESDYAYPLDEYYMYQWTVTKDDIQDARRVDPDFGPGKYINEIRMLNAHVFVDDVQVLRDGNLTEKEPNEAGQIFDRYYESLDISYVLSQTTDEYGSIAIFHDYYEGDTDTIEPGELRARQYILDSGQDDMTVQMFLPKETSDLETPEGVPNTPDSPGGSANLVSDVLGAFGLNTANGKIVFVIVSMIFINILLVYTNLTGITLPIVNVALLGLFYFGGFLPFWVMMTLVMILALMFIGLRGGMQRYD